MKRILILVPVILLCLAGMSNGFYFEMALTSNQQPMGSVKVYGQNGNSRSEATMTTPMGSMTIVSLFLKNNPDVIYTLYESSKTYSETDLSKSSQWQDANEDQYEITVLGKEKVNGYNTTHVKIKRKDLNIEEEMWTSAEVANYKEMAAAKSKFTGKINLNKALEAKGAAGFPVRVKVSEHSIDFQIDLVKMESKTNAASLFSLDGYSKASTASPSNGQNQKR